MNDKIHSLCAFAQQHRITLEQAQELVAAGGPAIFDFDEALYLEENPDVARSLANGEFNSALHFYFLHGRYENRSGGPEGEPPPEIKFKGPTPPRALRKRVHGHTQLFTFELGGAEIARNILDAVQSRIPLDRNTRVLDFGCGCGRVLVYFQDATGCRITGSDIDGEAIAWCTNNLADFGTFVQNEPLRPLPMPEGTFDLVYSVSVFTHLPERMQFVWLNELSRVTKPGGYLLLTTRGTREVPLNWLQRLRFRSTGFVYVPGGKTPGLPDFYRNAFHTESYIRRKWSKFFEITGFKARGINGDQDWVLCRKRP